MNTRRFVAAVCLFAVTSVSALVACSSDDSTSSVTPSATNGTGESVVTHISAAQGGVVTDKSGKATLAIPPGALAADTDITLAVAAAANGSAGDIYDFGPEGLQFLKPATLTLKGDGITVPEGKTAAVGLFDGTAFKKIEGSAFSAGVATAPVTHFSKYAIVIVDGNIVLAPPASCAEAKAKFTNCGGDPTGTWKFLEYCIDPKVLDQMKPGDCTDWSASIDISTTQTITFTDTTVTVSDGVSTSVITTDFAVSCMVPDASAVQCTSLSDDKTTCTDGATAGKCHCEQTETKNVTGQTKPIDTDPASKGEYCVQGDLLTVREFKDGTATGTLFVLKRQ